MNPTAAILVLLMLISLMLAVILTIAWHSFGRPRYALIWGAAFGLAFVKWAVLAAMQPWSVVQGQMLPMIGIGDCLISALIAIGFRQRSRRPARWGPILGGATVAALMTVVAALAGEVALRNAIPLAFGAIMLALSMFVVRRRRLRLRLPEKATQIMLGASFLLHLSAALLALGPDRAMVTTGGPLGVLMLLGLPAAFAGTGLFALFLIAADLAERMRRLADIDPLTGVLNRRGFEEQAGRAIALARRHGYPLSVAVADLDRFKKINDVYGHAAGDAALQGFADYVQRTVRSGDLFGRLGGEEFALLLVNAPAARAGEAVNRLRALIADMPATQKRPFTMTVSFGVTELQDYDADLTQLLDRADRALYLSKVGGRNRVTIAETAGLVLERVKDEGPAGAAAARPNLSLIRGGSTGNRQN